MTKSLSVFRCLTAPPSSSVVRPGCIFTNSSFVPISSHQYRRDGGELTGRKHDQLRPNQRNFYHISSRQQQLGRVVVCRPKLIKAATTTITTKLKYENNSFSNNNTQYYMPFSSSSQGGSGGGSNRRNPGLASVISQGIQTLESSAADVAAKTKNEAYKKNKNEVRPRQLQEAQRIKDVVIDSLDDLCSDDNRYNASGGGANLLCIRGEPITILDVQVNRDIKQAKVFWTLPISILLDETIPKSIIEKVMIKMKENIEENGGGKVIQKHVSSRLRSYYPPRLKFVPAPDTMVYHAIEELVNDGF